MNTTMPPNFKNRAAKIIEEVSAMTYIDKLDTEILEAIVKDALVDYYHEAYDDGHFDGYDAGYDAGYEDCYADRYAKNKY